jgi:hypothetical protein
LPPEPLPHVLGNRPHRASSRQEWENHVKAHFAEQPMFTTALPPPRRRRAARQAAPLPPPPGTRIEVSM